MRSTCRQILANESEIASEINKNNKNINYNYVFAAQPAFFTTEFPFLWRFSWSIFIPLT